MAKDRGRFADTLELVKFICKEFWIVAFQKQVDNLKVFIQFNSRQTTGAYTSCLIIPFAGLAKCLQIIFREIILIFIMHWFDLSPNG
jgi:hypothetical protein